MKLLHRTYICMTAIMVLAMAAQLQSCKDEIELPEGEGYVEAGLPANVTIALDIPDMKVQSRALTDAESQRVNNLWIGIYDAEPSGNGKLKAQHYVTRDDEEGEHQLRTLTINDINTTSGRCYIVAVANAGNNMGMSSDATLGGDKGERVSLLSMLQKADNLEKYKKIAAVLASTADTDYTAPNLVMAGTYLKNYGTGGIEHPDDQDWTKLPVVTIPAGEVKITSGKIHLRRLVSLVSFDIKSGDGINVRPRRWRVVNNPRMSYLQEQDGNAGDHITGHLDPGDNSNYGDSYPETEIELITENNVSFYRFSFYTFENKRTARAGSCNSYDDREKEYKTEDVTDPTDNKAHHDNTGVYQALCATADTPDLKTGTNVDNFATIVEITCDVDYQTQVGGTTVQRTGTAVYTVHLGYMGNDPSDFNVRRNYKYRYTMTVLGLNQIVLEAQGEETHPGLEGAVVDATAANITVDAHYGMVNIQLSNVERAHLRYFVEAPYASRVESTEGYGSLANDNGVASARPSDDNEYYNWIRIKPAPAENIFAEYKTSTTDEPWYLHDLVTVGTDGRLDHRGYNDNTGSTTDNTQRWYTVFINEHVYEGTGHPLNDWVNFVNMPDPRTVLFLVQDVDISADRESRYSRGKYLISQRSIQTYYTTEISAYGTSDPTALGVEHVNESYGKRIDWRWTVTSSGTALSLNNGRWNQWKFLLNNVNGTTNPSTANSSSTSRATRNWYATDQYMGTGTNGSTGLLRYVTAAGGNATTRTGYIRADDKGYAVPALSYYQNASETREWDPTGATGYYEAMALCMSRNRDLDGDGRISPNEVRWYLPAEGKYERIMLGRNSLVTPMFSVSAGGYYCNSNDPIAMDNNNFGFGGVINDQGNINQIQYISSNHMKFFPEEGGSYHNNISIHWAGGGAGRYPWNIRCVRNLGVDLSTVNSSMNIDPVGKAYTTEKNDDGNVVFVQRYYYGRSLRPAVDSYIMTHTVADLDKNRIPKKFEVAPDYVSINIGAGYDYATFRDAFDNNAPCKDVDSGTGGVWRAPNQRELMMMLNEGVISGTESWSCTMDAYPTSTRFSKCSGSQIEMGYPGSTLRVRCVRDLE